MAHFQPKSTVWSNSGKFWIPLSNDFRLPHAEIIINIGSIASRITPPNSAVYTGTKGAVDAITEAAISSHRAAFTYNL